MESGRAGKLDKIVKEILSDAAGEVRNSLAVVGMNENRVRQSESTADEIIDDLEERLRARHCPSSRRQLSRLGAQLVRLVQCEMSSEILREIQRLRFAVDDDVDECVVRLTQSPQCSSLEEQLRTSIVGQLDSSSTFGSDETWPNKNVQLISKNEWSLAQYTDSATSTTTTTTNDAFETSSMGSSINYGAGGGGTNCWEALSAERLERLSEMLHVSNGWTSQQDAVRVLTSLPMSEVIQSEVWPRLRTPINELLLLDDEAAFEAGLRLHLKMLNSSASSQCVVESYTSLVEALHSLLTHTTNDHRIMALIEVINTFQKVVPLYWNRYPEAHIRRMIVHTFEYLLDLTTSALTMVALIDRNAQWFQNWMQGKNVRKIILNSLSTTHVLSTLTSNCLALFERCCPVNVVFSYSNSEFERLHLFKSYSQHQLDYITTLHVLRIVGHLLSSADGRAAFDGGRGKVTASADFMTAAFRGACTCARHVATCNEFCLANVVVDILGGLIAREQFWCFDDDGCRLLDILREVITDWLDGPPTTHDLHLLDHVTRTLLHVTNNSLGLQSVLKALENDVVGRFAEKLLLLTNDDDDDAETLKTRAVKICCRVLADHRGIVTLKLMGKPILFKIAEEWEASLRETESRTTTTTTTTPVPLTSTDDRDCACWLHELRVVGTTPLGVAALYETNLLQDILIWTEGQMNKENRETGTIPLLFLSQVASACDFACPTLTTHLMPFANQVADSILLATELESIGTEPTIGPPSLERLNTTAHRLLSDLICILPSCQAVKTLLGTSDKTADGIQRLPFFIKLVMSGVQDWCPRTELTCTIGLHLIKLLSTDLNVWLYLESNFHFQETLLQAQAANMEDGIIDEHFLLRNYFLVKMAEIGGESEKYLPSTDASQEDFPVSYMREYPAVTSLPIPEKYLVPFGPLSAPSVEIDYFLKETLRNLADKEWLVYCREVFRNCLTDNIPLRGHWFGGLLYFVVEAQERDADVVSQESDKRGPPDMSLDNRIGCQLVVSYGLRLSLLDEGIKSAHDLMQILQATNTSQGFDWITATVFLLLGGDVERTLTFGNRLSCLPHGRQLRGQDVDSHLELKCSNLWITFCHCVEVVLNGDLPLVANAVQRSGMTVGQICRPWISQCFWNILDWEEICTYFGLYLVMGADFQVYYVVALFRHLQKEIVQHVAEDDFPLFMRETRLNRFCTRDHLPFIDHLESKYRGLILSQR